MKRLFVAFLVVGCGGGDSTSIDATGPDDTLPNPDGLEPDAPEGGFSMTSPAFVEGQAIPVVHTCDGANTSPQLEWGTFDGALSYSLVFTDLSNNLIHWVIYDIPASATGLPADVDKVFEPPDVAGAKQTLSFGQSGTRGYLGPCPPNEHTYEYKVYAIDVATLPGTSQLTNRSQAEAIILQHDLGSAALSGTYERP
jgi:Raf kinase inhibitor-like YbhB/YbcL family protein